MKTETMSGWTQRLRPGLMALGFLGALALVPGCFVDSGPGPGPAVCGDGQIQPSWIITVNKQVVECAPGDEVDMRVDSDATIFTFPCSDHNGITTPVAGGVQHNVSFRLFDANNNILSETGSMPLFVPCDTIQPTPRVEFSLTP
jgi:hypothetical protein